MKNLAHLKSKIRDVKDFPTKGVVFKDIAPLFDDAKAFREIIDNLCEHLRPSKIDKVVGIESRGFMLSAPVAYLIQAGAVMARKKGKLPAETISVAHALEYGKSVLEIHTDAIKKGERVAVIDDVLATGGTMGAAISLVEQLGGDVVATGVLLELEEFHGREALEGYNIFSLLSY